MKRYLPVMFISPALSLLFVFIFLPILFTIFLSFVNWNMIEPNIKFVGLKNYINLITEKHFWVAAYNSLLYAIIAIVLDLILPYITAYAITRVKSSWHSLFKILIFLPTTLSLAVGSIIFLWLYNPVLGPFSYFLKEIGYKTPIGFLTDYHLVIYALSIIVGWKLFGYNVIILLSSLLNVPVDQINSAKIDGATPWQIFIHIIIPQTSPTILYAFFMTIVLNIQYIFVPIQILTNGGPDYASTNLVYLIYQYGFNFFRIGMSAACSIVTLIIFIIFMILLFKFIDKKVYYES